MVFDVEDYEKECKKIRTENAELLELFETDLAGLSEKTIQRHLRNVDFYINTYLLREGALSFKDGTEYIDSYLGDFFIRRCMWSTPGSIKSTAASIKKFYKCMLDHKKIEKDQYQLLCETIKENMEQWRFDCEMYNDPGAVNPFVFF